MNNYTPTKCESCQHLIITGGDWVDYGSTRAQLPDDWECSAEWQDGELTPDKNGDDKIGYSANCIETV